MTEQKPYEKNFRWLLLLALLINFLFLFLLFFLQFETPDWFFKEEREQENNAPVVFESPPEQPQEEPVKSNEIAALKPRASQFGATEKVQDEPEFTPGTFDQLIPELQGKDQEENEKSPPKEDTKEVEKKSEEHKEIESIKNEQPLSPETQPDLLFRPEIKKEQTINKPPQQEPGQQKKASQRSTPGAQSKIASPIEKKLTFNDLASGFLASWQDEGNDWLERKGNENIRPDFEEMRYLSYLQKIAWYMQNAWQRQERVMLKNPPLAIVVTQVRISIDKQGNLKEVLMLQSCGVSQLDEVVLKGIREASPYPPLPEHFKKEVVSFDFGVKHWNVNSGSFNFNVYR